MTVGRLKKLLEMLSDDMEVALMDYNNDFKHVVVGKRPDSDLPALVFVPFGSHLPKGYEWTELEEPDEELDPSPSEGQDASDE